LTALKASATIRQSYFRIVEAGAVTLVRIRPKGQVTIPDDIRREARVVAGDYLAVSVRDGLIVLEPKSLIDATQAWFWATEWQAGEREASADIAAGRTRRFESDEDFISSLK
jgi:AbrB family looped-hinge helix DNA binding protein